MGRSGRVGGSCSRDETTIICLLTYLLGFPVILGRVGMGGPRAFGRTEGRPSVSAPFHASGGWKAIRVHTIPFEIQDRNNRQ